MKICFVHHQRIEPAQADFYTHIPVRMARLLGTSAQVYMLFIGQLNTRKLKEHGVTAHRLRYGANGQGTMALVFNSCRQVPEIYRLCKAEGFEVVLNVTDHYLFFLTCCAASLAGSKTIARVTGILPRGKNLSVFKRIRRFLADRLERLSLTWADRILVLSESLKRDLVKNKIDKKKIWVVSQGVDAAFFKPRELAAVQQKPRKLLYVGRLEPVKGLEVAILAYLKAREHYPDLELLICGEGRQKSYLQHQYGKEENITYLGFVPHEELPSLYQAADIFVLPSYSEGLPNVILEAMASRLPVIATSVGESPLLLAEGRGIIVSPGKVEEMANAILRLREDSEFRVACAIRAREYILSQHTFEAVRPITWSLFSFNAG